MKFPGAKLRSRPAMISIIQAKMDLACAVGAFLVQLVTKKKV